MTKNFLFAVIFYFFLSAYSAAELVKNIDIKGNRAWMRKDAELRWEMMQIEQMGPDWREQLANAEEAQAGAMPGGGGPAGGGGPLGGPPPAFGPPPPGGEPDAGGPPGPEGGPPGEPGMPPPASPVNLGSGSALPG